MCDIVGNAILIVGAPRSGTTWLAKIFDSHPDVLYRHEPDELFPPTLPIRDSMRVWIGQRDPRTAAKAPFFRKSWQSGPAHLVRTSLAYAAKAAGRIGIPAWQVPDLGHIAHARAVIKSVRLRGQLGDFARSCPDGRALLVLRNPFGQIDSMIRGARDHRFELSQSSGAMPLDADRAMAFAARHGVSPAAFQHISPAAQFAWSWREFNETAMASIENQPNAMVVVHKDLCFRPIEKSREVMDFTGLLWAAQTEHFLAESSHHQGFEEYYDIRRDTASVPDRWRRSLSLGDQQRVRAVVRESPLMRYWPESMDADRAVHAVGRPQLTSSLSG